LIRLRGVSFAYRPAAPVLAAVDLDLAPGLTLIVGPNGCGKSTLLKILAGIERPHAGTVDIDGHDLWQEEVAARGALAYVPESSDLSPFATIRETLLLVGRLRGEQEASADQALDRLGLAGLGNRVARELSAGQRRRVLLAAAQIGEPRVLLLDEPLEALDPFRHASILAWIDTRVGSGATTVVASHDLDAFGDRASAVISVRDGRCLELTPLPAAGAARRQRLMELGGEASSAAR
jgi:ABC-2 type transport system ATP-binding protein